MKTSLILLLIGLTFSISTFADKTFEYHFSQTEEFQVSFSDYPIGREDDYELKSQNGAKLPSDILFLDQGLMISGNNHSDDLFMYAYKKMEGLKPNTEYQIDPSLEFASNASSDSTGVGGSPGDSVYVKLGVVSKEPQRIVDGSNMVLIDLDKGNQGVDGKDMLLLGTIGVDTKENHYQLKTLPKLEDEALKDKLKTYRVRTNDKGEAWIVFGTDSGYESITTMFYTHLVVVLKEST